MLEGARMRNEVGAIARLGCPVPEACSHDSIFVVHER